MVRETRHLWVGNLPDNIREERILEHFKRYGRVQSVKLLPRGGSGGGGIKEETCEMACTVAFMDIKSASKAHTSDHKLDERTLTTEYYEPAAIPSTGSSPPLGAGPIPYTTSPGSTRFPNGHRTVRGPDGEYLRRASYHETARGRNRDRNYRNGPPTYNNVLERHRSINNSNPASTWTTTTPYENTAGGLPTTNNRYTNQTNDTGYTAAGGSVGGSANVPPLSNESATSSNLIASSATMPNNSSVILARNATDSSSTKKVKTKSSGSGSRSPSPSASTSSPSPSRSRSRSSSSSSSSSTSRETSSTGSPKSRRAPTANASTHQPVVHSEDRRPLAICVRNLPIRSSDTSLKDGLFHEYKKHGKVTWVKVVGQSAERHAIVCFKKPEDVEKALEVSYDKLFFGCKIEVAPYQGYDVDDNDLRPYEAEIDEFHPKATRTLFIGNLEKDVTSAELRNHFEQFGNIIEIDIKKQGLVNSYAFCQYSDIVSVVKAIRTMDGEHLGNNRVKLGFGKSMLTNCVWIDGVSDNVNEKYLIVQFDPFGVINQVYIDREKGQSLIFYEAVVSAQAAVTKMRGHNLRGKKIQVDFASRECQDTFFDHLEKQGYIMERPGVEERRDSTSRNFESITTPRFSRYETPTRPRTSSYSSRSGAAAGQISSTAIPSPGTPGSVTPRGTGSRSRIPRYPAEYYDTATTEYTDRIMRSYDEYSQGSAASHDDPYDHEFAYHDALSHAEPIESRLQPPVDHITVQFAAPDMRNLQKERVHLLEQLEDCPSSGDEIISPRKRLKLEHMDGSVTSEVIIETNRDHRKVMEVRRLSDVSLKHSRRPSVDGKHHERGSYLPHAVCKRRKTAGSDGGRHHYESSESVGGSRPGTPLCDERPEHFTPSEPRRIPREREGPLTLPLPKFAAQLIGRGNLSVSVAGIKGQKDTVLSSPPPAVTSPRISHPKPPSPAQVPPPASPPPRPPSLSSNSNSSDSDAAPPSPSLDERIRSLDEKYEKWSGSRAISAAGGDALAKLDATRERFKIRHKLLDIDLKEVQPSEIVKSVMAKRSVFDEDTKRLENVGEKYEPRDFSQFGSPRSSGNTVVTAAPVNTVQTSVPATPTKTPPPAIPPPLIKMECTSNSIAAPTLKVATINPAVVAVSGVVTSSSLPLVAPVEERLQLQPSATSSSSSPLAVITTPAKGLQYPFPSHPPTQPSPTPAGTTVVVVSTSIATTIGSTSSNSTTTTTTTTTTTRNSSHGDNRLKSCATVPTAASDNNTLLWTASKVNVNNRISSSSTNNNNNCTVVTNPSSQNVSKNSSDSNKVASADTTAGLHSNNSLVKTEPMDIKPVIAQISGVKSNQRDSSSSDNSGKSRRNSETDKQSDNCDSKESERLVKARSEIERFEKERLERERIERERLEKERQERERLEQERVEKEKSNREREEKERLEKERLEKERLEKERLEKERVEKERLQKERLEKERLEKERLEKERLEKERLDKERLDKERLEKQRLEKERLDREQQEKERQEKERLEKTRLERERLEREQLENERLEKERQEREKAEKEKRREREERDRKEKEERQRREREERERLEEQQENERRDRRLREERERKEREDLEKQEYFEKERVEKERFEKEQRKKDKEERKSKEDNHDKRKDEHRHRENHSEPKHKDSILDIIVKNAKEEKRENHIHVSRNSHDSKNSRHLERDSERRKDSVKENRENNIYEKTKSLFNEMSEVIDRPVLESQHLSLDLDRRDIMKGDPGRRKERNNSLPATIGTKRRMSSHEISELTDENKKLKLYQEQKKLSERRDSKDSKEDKLKLKHKNSSSKNYDDKFKLEKHNNLKEIRDKDRDKDKEKDREREKDREKDHDLDREKEKEKEREREERHRNKARLEKYKIKAEIKAELKAEIKAKSRDKESPTEPPKSPGKEMADRDFLSKLDLIEVESQHLIRKELKEKRKHDSPECEEHNNRLECEFKRIDMDFNSLERRERKEKQLMFLDQKTKDEFAKSYEEQRKLKHRIRKLTQDSSDNSDSDEPKKHSIFDIVDDTPAYISMYDKVKARSCKNMQKQEEEKKQEKIKAKFNQLKQSRAKREEKKRSTSWDEDSDSDTMKSRRHKMLIASSDEDESGICKLTKPKEMYSDSDSDRIRQLKSEPLDSSDDEQFKSLQRKGSKSRIASDSSDDDFKNVRNQIKFEMLSDNEDQGFADLDDKYKNMIKEEFSDSSTFKKETKIIKSQETFMDIRAQIFGDSNSSLPDMKPESINNSTKSFGNISSTDECNDRKDKNELRKKHKKKQKRQKSSLSSEESSKLESVVDTIQSEELSDKKNSEKRKHLSKKERKRDKIKDDDKNREKSRKPKKSRSESKEFKRDGKMETIFGSLSDDSEDVMKDLSSLCTPTEIKTPEDVTNLPPISYASDSDNNFTSDKARAEEKERSFKEEHRKRKEKKRREKEKRLREEAANENSIDFADLGKQLEDNIKDDSNERTADTKVIKDTNEIPAQEIITSVDVFKFADVEQNDTKKDGDIRKEPKEKKKKRKKSKDEKQRHHHHHDKTKLKSPDFKKDLLPPTITVEDPNNSLPNILEISSPPHNKSSPSLDLSISPQNREPIMLSPLPSTPTTSKEKNREKFIPTFRGNIDEKVHENAVKSISEFVPKTPEIQIKEEEEPKVDAEAKEEKPRVVISQEETEDAVAALLGESFCSTEFKDCYTEEPSLVPEQIVAITEENAQDDEEMRQAVQSLNSSELEIKPDTPQSEHDLQIDTDTEETDDTALRFDQAPRTPDMVELSQPPKSPEVSSAYYRKEDAKPSTIIVKTTPSTPVNLGSPPSLTLIKPPSIPTVTAEITKKTIDKPIDTTAPSLPLLPPVQSPSVISKPWSQIKEPSLDSAQVIVSPKIQTIDKIPPLAIPTSTVVSLKPQNKIMTTPTSTFTNTNTKLDRERSPTKLPSPKLAEPKIIQNIPVLQPIKQNSLHNMPQQMPYPVPSKSQDIQGLLSPKPHTIAGLNRFPITPGMIPKPMQSQTVVLPQPKLADVRHLERPPLVYHTAPPSMPRFATYSQVRPNQQAVRIGPSPVPRQALILPTNTSTGTFNSYRPPPQSVVSREILVQKPQISVVQEKPKILPTSVPQQYLPVPPLAQTSPQPTSPVVISAPHSTIISTSPSTSVSSKQPFTPVIQEAPKLVSIASSVSPAAVPMSPITPVPPITPITPLAPLLPVVNDTKLSPTIQPSIIQSIPKPTPITVEPLIIDPLKPDLIKVAEVIRTSSPSPVIVTPPARDVVKVEEVARPKTAEVVKVPLAIQTVTDELNLSLRKEEPIKKEESVEVKLEDEVKPAVFDKKTVEITSGPVITPEVVKVVEPVKIVESIPTEMKLEPSIVPDNVSVIKETDKFDEDHAETESVLSNSSKERLSADIIKDSIDSKEDSDYWSAKEVNIDSVIKNLCSADEMSDHSSEVGKDDWMDDKSKDHEEHEIIDSHKSDLSHKIDESEFFDESMESTDEKEISVRGSRGRGGRARGRKARGGATKRGGKTLTPTVVKDGQPQARRGGRGGRPRNDRKVSNSNSDDIYEFKDDSDETANKDRPRLILTIKSPAVSANGSSTLQPTSTIVNKEVVNKDPIVVATIVQTAAVKPLVSGDPSKEEFASPMANTRKSRRLQERDVNRTTIDDTIDDVVKNTVLTRSASGTIITSTGQGGGGGTPRRSARQTITKPSQDSTPRKSPRAGRKTKDRRASETTDDSSEEKSVKSESISSPSPPSLKLDHDMMPATPTEPDHVKDVKPQTEVEVKVVEVVKEKPHEGLKAAMLRRVKGEMNQEPQTLIDPVTGMLIPMRECEENRYIPVAGKGKLIGPMPLVVKLPQNQLTTDQTPSIAIIKPAEQIPASTVVAQVAPTIAKSPITTLKPPQSLKAHVLSSQTAKLLANHQQQLPKPVTLTQQPQPQQLPTIGKTTTSITQNLNINVPSSAYDNIPSHLSPRPIITTVQKPMLAVKVIQSPLSPQHQQKQLIQQQQLNMQVKQQVLQKPPHVMNAIKQQQQQPMKGQPSLIQQQAVNIAKAPLMKPHLQQSQQQQILTGAVASPPLKTTPHHGSQSRVVQQQGKTNMDAPKVEVTLGGCVMVPRPNASPQNQSRHVLQAGMPVPAYEASLLGERSLYNRSRSPPPAHQNSPSPQGENMAHFPPGFTPAQYIHSQIMYQQYMRQSYHMPRSPGQEGEEAPVNSPPLELRRPGSVGIALTGRSNAVPHSLQSPHDRTSDSPQMGQVYQTSRLPPPQPSPPHYHPAAPSRYYDQPQPTEPPPAHRPLVNTPSNLQLPLLAVAPSSSSSSLANNTAQETSAGGTSHLVTQVVPSPVSRQQQVVLPVVGTRQQLQLAQQQLQQQYGAVIGGHIAGGAMVTSGGRYGIGGVMAEAPTTQRGLQAATPPHASQVPAQAESLLMLLRQYPCMWQGLLALKNDQAAVQMYFVSGNDTVAKTSLPKNNDGTTPPLRIFQRMRLEPLQVEGVARKMQMENEHCMLLALPCGHDHMDVLKQSTNLSSGFITYLQMKQAAGIVNVAAPGTTQPPAYVVHIFPSCDFVNENLRRIAPSLLERVADIAHLLIVITTV